MSQSPSIAYLAEGKLYLKQGDSKPVLVESDFARGILERLERDRQRNEWKQDGGMAWNFGRGGFGGMAPGPPPAEVRRIRITGITRSPKAGHLLYALDTDYVGGLFEYEIATGYERRLMHRNQFCASDLVCRDGDGEIAMSLRSDAGTSHLALISLEGRGLKQVTEGDCIDECPAWSPAGNRALVYQSAGVARDEHGNWRGLAPYAIHQLDLEKEESRIVAESPQHDLIVPRLAADGTLYYIRRPYQRGPVVSKWKLLTDVLLFPFRVVRAIVHFLNFFSMIFSKKPLMTAGGPDQEGPDQRFVQLYGRIIDARKIARETAAGEPAALVPGDWELIRQRTDGSTEVVAKGVAHYDLAPDGRLLYTNGGKVLAADGPATRELDRGAMIERVAWVN